MALTPDPQVSPRSRPDSPPLSPEVNFSLSPRHLSTGSTSELSPPGEELVNPELENQELDNQEPDNQEPQASMEVKRSATKKYKCKTCSMEFVRQHWAKNHCKPFSWVCDQCGTSISKKNNVKRHIQRCEKAKTKVNLPKVEPTIQDRTCMFCERVFKNKKTCQSHIYKVHQKGEGEFKCSNCDFECRKSGYLKKHVTLVHKASEQFNCEECDITYLSANGLRRHKKTAHSIKAKISTDVEKGHIEGDIGVEQDSPLSTEPLAASHGDVGTVGQSFLTARVEEGPGVVEQVVVGAGPGHSEVGLGPSHGFQDTEFVTLYPVMVDGSIEGYSSAKVLTFSEL